ncbi:hypothetical protein Q31b_28290 [Novipirellula aureliae]|uniref:Uncharacterized protein n=1 Tax=Novipirellula aureliae TaxID=2527966 RepID=A0A5C6DY70_9BACT|nr:hypothetical protein Q31b_28290 [Novipirellula aureliae]
MANLILATTRQGSQTSVVFAPSRIGAFCSFEYRGSSTRVRCCQGTLLGSTSRYHLRPFQDHCDEDEGGRNDGFSKADNWQVITNNLSHLNAPCCKPLDSRQLQINRFLSQILNLNRISHVQS